MEIISLKLEQEIKKHFIFQEKLKHQINEQIDKIIMENMLVRRILLNMIEKIIFGAKSKDINIFAFFDDFEEILRAYLKKEEGLLIQEFSSNTNEKEQKKIITILKANND